MARIVATIGLPHTPAFPALVAREGPDSETGRLYNTVRQNLERFRPDILVIFDTDHLNTFFLDHLPVFAIGVADSFAGPNDDVPALPMRQMRSHAALAAHLRAEGIFADFDLSLVQEFQVDHSIAVPLRFIDPHSDIPVVPVFIGGHVPPLPAAHRCFALGRAIRRAVETWPANERVVVIGSGSFSLEVYGPRIDLGRSFGVPDPDWVARVAHYIREADFGNLIRHATQDQLLKAGNVGGELLNWIAMLGAIDPAKSPDWMELQPQFGHGYAVWDLGSP